MNRIAFGAAALIVAWSLSPGAQGQEAPAPVVEEQTSLPDTAQENGAAAAPEGAGGEAGLGDLEVSPETLLEEPGGPAPIPFKLKLSGEHEFGFHIPVYGDALDYKGEIKSPAVRNLLGVELQDGALKVVSQWHLDYLTNPGILDENGQTGSYDSLTRIRPGENLIVWSLESLRLAAGYQIFAWGVADKVNPTDNVNPRDYTLGPNAEKIPLLSLDATWYPTDELSVQALLAPAEQADRWPLVWADKLPDRLFAGKSFTLPDQVLEVPNARAVVEKPLDFGPESVIAGGRINWRSSAVDLSASYLYDVDPYYTPRFDTATEPVYLTGTQLPTGKEFARVAGVTLERKRLHRFGLDAKTTAGMFGLWAEAAYTLTENGLDGDATDVRRSRLEVVLGTDFSYGPNDTCYANLQYVGSWIPGYDSTFGKDYPGHLPATDMAGDAAYMQEFYQRAFVDKLGLDTQGMLHGVTLNLKWELLDALVTPQITLIYFKPFDYDDSQETRYGSLALNPEVDIKPLDSFHIKVGADLFYAWVKPSGGDVSLDTTADRIGIYTPSNNVYLKLEYKWNYDLDR